MGLLLSATRFGFEASSDAAASALLLRVVSVVQDSETSPLPSWTVGSGEGVRLLGEKHPINELERDSSDMFASVGEGINSSVGGV